MLVGDIGKQLEHDQFSGIVGLAPQNDPNNRLTSFVEQLTVHKDFKPVFSFYLPKGQNGKLMLGGYDVGMFGRQGLSEQDINWSSVADDEKTWSVSFNGLRFKEGHQINTKSEKVMLDTGVSYSLVPQADLESISKSLMGYNVKCEPPSLQETLRLYQCSCDNIESLAPLQLFIGKNFFELPVSHYIQKIPDAEERNCKLLLHPYDTSFGSDNKWVLGVQFLQQFYSIFDFENHRIGLVASR